MKSKKKQNLNIKLSLALSVLFLGFLVNFFSANYINYKNLDSIDRNPDLFLSRFTQPHPNYMFLAEFILVSILIIFICAHYKEKTILIDSIIILGIFSILRGLFIPLTILSGLEPEGFLSNFITFSKGLFPSGHSALAFILLFKSNKYKWLFFCGAVVVSACLIVSQQHYTIDILSSLIFVYAIKSFTEKHL